MASPKIVPRPLERPLSQVAADILNDYQDKPSFYAAKPYVFALLDVRTTDLSTPYMAETAGDLVRYLVESNLANWRGQVARRVKEELRAALADYDQKRRQQ